MKTDISKLLTINKVSINTEDLFDHLKQIWLEDNFPSDILFLNYVGYSTYLKTYVLHCQKLIEDSAIIYNYYTVQFTEQQTKEYNSIINDKDFKIIDQLYLNWINKEFHTPINFEIKPSAAGYYLYSDSYNKVHNTTTRSRQLLNNNHVKIYHAFNTLKELHV